jgi:hypothetical protein
MKAPATTRKGKVPEWGEQTAWLVVSKSVLMGKTPGEIAVNLLPTGPKLRSIQCILKRFHDGMERLTGRDHKKRADTKLDGALRVRWGFFKYIYGFPPNSAGFTARNTVLYCIATWVLPATHTCVCSWCVFSFDPP